MRQIRQLGWVTTRLSKRAREALSVPHVGMPAYRCALLGRKSELSIDPDRAFAGKNLMSRIVKYTSVESGDGDSSTERQNLVDHR